MSGIIHLSLMENNSVASVKDPSITNLCNLSKTSHIVEAVNKANNVLGLIKNIQSVLQKRTFLHFIHVSR